MFRGKVIEIEHKDSPMGWFKKFTNSINEMVREGFDAANEPSLMADVISKPEKYQGITSDQIRGNLVPEVLPQPQNTFRSSGHKP